MAEEKKAKVTDFRGSGPIEPGDVDHRVGILEGMLAELARRYVILERRILALEARGMPLRVGEASRHLPVLDELLDQLRAAPDVTDLARRIGALETRAEWFDARISSLMERSHGQSHGQSQQGQSHGETERETTPWEAEGISKATYYRRKKEAGEPDDGSDEPPDAA